MFPANKIKLSCNYSALHYITQLFLTAIKNYKNHEGHEVHEDLKNITELYHRILKLLAFISLSGTLFYVLLHALRVLRGPYVFFMETKYLSKY